MMMVTNHRPRRRCGAAVLLAAAVIVVVAIAASCCASSSSAASWVPPPRTQHPTHPRQQQQRQQQRQRRHEVLLLGPLFVASNSGKDGSGRTAAAVSMMRAAGTTTTTMMASPASRLSAPLFAMINGQDDDNDSDEDAPPDGRPGEGVSRFREFASSMLRDDDNENDDGGLQPRVAAAAETTKARTPKGSEAATRKATATATTTDEMSSWKKDVDELLNVSTPNARRQKLLQRLLNSNRDIRSSVEQALRDRTIDPLLTPQTRKIQDGTRAVARQVTSDILPSLAQRAAVAQQHQNQQQRSSSSSSSSTNSWFPTPPLPLPPLTLGSVEAAVADVTKVGDRLFSLAQRQFQRGLDEMSRDLADPRRIPDRVVQQAADLVQETLNVFAETPVNLKEPTYRVVISTDDYEIRDYDGYRVASTRAASATNAASSDSWAQDGAAFATLASYVLGGNQESRVLEMTTPVTTTMTGEMRFYLAISEADAAPEPTSTTPAAAVEIQTLPPARLAVRKFPGFATDGEVSRQKSALLTALELDGIELDVGHGQTVPHVIFQYNPPYTVPVLRRNEIAVPVVGPSDQVEAELRNGVATLGNDFWSDVE